MKKQILAGLMALVTLLSTSAAASGNIAPNASKDYTSVSKVTTNTYTVSTSFIDIPLNVSVPKRMMAFINPYKAKVKVEGKETGSVEISDSIVSWYYELKNNTQGYGVTVDLVKAYANDLGGGVKLVGSSEFPASGQQMVGSKYEKKICLAIVSSASGTAASPGAMQTLSTGDGNLKATATAGGRYVFTGDSTDFTKIAYIKGITASQTGTQVTRIAFTGSVAMVDANGEELKWRSTDRVTAAFSLRFTPADPTSGPL